MAEVAPCIGTDDGPRHDLQLQLEEQALQPVQQLLQRRCFAPADGRSRDEASFAERACVSDRSAEAGNWAMRSLDHHAASLAKVAGTARVHANAADACQRTVGPSDAATKDASTVEPGLLAVLPSQAVRRPVMLAMCPGWTIACSKASALTRMPAHHDHHAVSNTGLPAQYPPVKTPFETVELLAAKAALHPSPSRDLDAHSAPRASRAWRSLLYAPCAVGQLASEPAKLELR
eukprot:CAMPEP_0181417208 /NCGR_PEP_ID=MMETSP1110-20121109/10921_1 /TAXON_ID=174948 /ORGANISM="Symbiodinium sp., Strain CCMP421" /LENGTH=232 /DNA_ID=CAMNT_0023540149 /DNA_START=422 /DNA_END=1116 /DNA_ORIENTATION=+